MQSVETQETEVPNVNSSISNNFLSTPRKWIVFILVILIMAAIASYSLTSPDRRNKNPVPTNTPGISPAENKLESSDMIVYGIWKDNKSYIKGYDLGSKKEYLLAELPMNIKKVTVLSASELLYIGNTNNRDDHGENLSIYDIKNNTSHVLFKAENGFGIDDYVISKNKKYIAVWEVAFASDSNILLNGKSRVYSVDKDNPAVKNLIYDETATVSNPVHYPRAITSSGEIFLDTFLPNSGIGWAYGLSTSNFTGTEKKDIPGMKNGTYATQPAISPDEKLLVFSGYNKGETDGAKIENGARKAVLRPDTVEVLDIQTGNRTPIPELSDENIYPFSRWDQNGEIVLGLVSEDVNNIGAYSYNLSTRTLKKINTQEIVVSFLSEQDVLTGKKVDSVSATGNLGDGYYSPFASLSILDTVQNNATTVSLTDNFIQLISLMPPGYFTGLEELDTDLKKTLQLQTFSFKPSLAPARENQQSIPPPEKKGKTCEELIVEACKQFMDQNGNPISGFDACYTAVMQTNACWMSPLYLYGNPGQKVNVKIETYVYNSNPFYNPDTGYNITLLEDSKMKVNNNIYDRISYDFFGKRVAPPDYGVIVSRDKLRETLTYFSKNLGLNRKETEDLNIYGSQNIKSPFVFVSFYDEKTSREILPLKFIPEPDTYMNIVFYFKEYSSKPSIDPKQPVFKKTPRTGFTVIEISEIIER